MQTVMSQVRRFLSGLVTFIKRRWKVIILLLIVIMALLYWQFRRAEANKPQYETQNPQRQDLVQTLEVSGVIDAKEKAQVRFLTGGKLTYLGAKEGEWVKKGQVLGRIDPATLQKQLEQDLNNYLRERYQADNYIYDTKDNYFERTVVRNREFNQLDLENSVLTVEIRDIAINDTAIKAPFEGLLTKVPTNVTGVQLLSTDVFEIVNPQTLIFRAEVDEADIAQVTAGQKAILTLDSYPDRDIETTISYISYTSSTNSSGTIFIVEMPIPAYSLETYRIGMNGDVRIELETEPNALTVPLTATRERDDKTYVDVLVDGEPQEREIQVSLETDEYVAVTGGLNESDQVIIPE